MKGFAFFILIFLVLSIIFQPFLEVVLLFVEKSQIDYAIRNSGTYSITQSTEKEDRSVLLSVIRPDQFIEKFNESFSLLLNVTPEKQAVNTWIYNSNDNTFNDFEIYFEFNTYINSITGESESICTPHVSSRYKYKTSLLKKVQQLNNSSLSFDYSVSQPFILNIRN